MSESDLTAQQTPAPTTAALTHLDERGHASMVDVGGKAETQRTARARVTVVMAAATLGRIVEADLPKGDVLAVARIAGIQAAKKTADLIPLCHPLALTKVAVDFTPDADAGSATESHLVIDTLCRLTGRTGVEMEALTAASVAALTIYDMCKAIDRGMRVTDLHLVEKLGGKSGHWRSDDALAAAGQGPSSG